MSEDAANSVRAALGLNLNPSAPHEPGTPEKIISRNAAHEVKELLGVVDDAPSGQSAKPTLHREPKESPEHFVKKALGIEDQSVSVLPKNVRESLNSDGVLKRVKENVTEKLVAGGDSKYILSDSERREIDVRMAEIVRKFMNENLHHGTLVTGGHDLKEHGGAPVTPTVQTSSGQTPKQ